MKRFLAVLLLTGIYHWVLLLGNIPAQAAPATPAKTATFASKHGYSITPPKGWATNRSGLMGTDVIFIAKPKSGSTATITITVKLASPGETLEQTRADKATLDNALKSIR